MFLYAHDLETNPCCCSQCLTVDIANKIVQKLSYLGAYGNHMINLWVWEVVAASGVPCCEVEEQHEQLSF